MTLLIIFIRRTLDGESIPRESARGAPRSRQPPSLSPRPCHGAEVIVGAHGLLRCRARRRRPVYPRCARLGGGPGGDATVRGALVVLAGLLGSPSRGGLLPRHGPPSQPPPGRGIGSRRPAGALPGACGADPPPPLCLSVCLSVRPSLVMISLFLLPRVWEFKTDSALQ